MFTLYVNKYNLKNYGLFPKAVFTQNEHKKRNLMEKLKYAFIKSQLTSC